MQREIKLRSWNKAWKCMYYLTGYHFVGRTHIQLYYLDADGDNATCTALIDNIIMMQYTGLKDKNGIEIYEGDILHHLWDSGNNIIKETVSEVKYSNGGFIVDDKKRADWELSIHALSSWAEIEVVGNVYNNPELIKEENHGTNK